jgi:hypothetical protein
MKSSVAFLALSLAITTTPAFGAGPTKQQCVAANEGAQDLRTAGKLHEARSSLATCLSTSCPRPVREDCAQRLADIEAAMPTVVFVVKDSASNDLSNVEVAMDGQPLLDKLDGSAVAIDPGEHRFAFEADGFRHIETTVVLHEGDKKRRVMVFLDSNSLTPPPATPAPAPAPPPARPLPAQANDGKTQRTIAYVLGGVGAASLVVGSIFGLAAKFTYDHACPSGTCTDQGHQDQQTAYGQATLSDVAFVAGGVLLGAGAVVYLTAPGKPVVVGIGPTMVQHGAGIGVRGSW